MALCPSHLCCPVCPCSQPSVDKHSNPHFVKLSITFKSKAADRDKISFVELFKKVSTVDPHTLHLCSRSTEVQRTKIRRWKKKIIRLLSTYRTRWRPANGRDLAHRNIGAQDGFYQPILLRKCALTIDLTVPLLCFCLRRNLKSLTQVSMMLQISQGGLQKDLFWIMIL